MINIDGCKIAPDRPAYIIAEAALNHGGSLNRALAMVSIAAYAGCDAVKFQTFRAAEFCRPTDPMFATFQQAELPQGAWQTIKAYCGERGIAFLSTPQNPSDLELLLEVGIPAIKVGSDDFCNLPLLREYARHNLPLILSTGMSTMDDVDRALEIAPDAVLLVCSSQYPCPVDEVNLGRIDTLQARAPKNIIGFSDHTDCDRYRNTASIAAAARGALVFERHFYDGGPCPDQDFACTLDELKAWVRDVHTAACMMGTGTMKLTPRERRARNLYQRRSGTRLRGRA